MVKRKKKTKAPYICECGARIVSQGPSLILRHELTDKHHNRLVLKGAIEERFGTPTVKKARKDLFYCRECKQTRRADPISKVDIMGHPGPTGEVKMEVEKPTVQEVIEKTGLSTSTSDVTASLNELEHQMKERIRSSEKVIHHIEEMRKVLSE